MAIITHMPSNRSVSDKHRYSVLKVIAGQHSVPLEGLLQAFPWIRWAELFSILNALREEGAVVLDQKGFDFIVRINESRCRKGDFFEQSSYCSKKQLRSRASNRHLTRS